MKQNVYLTGIIFLLIFLIKNEAKTQDIHYSQFYNSPLNINPALTGVFNGDMRIIGSLRDQWRVIPVPYTTFSGSYDMKYLPKKSDKGFYGLGAIFNYDQAGDGNFNVTDLNVSGSYTYIMNPKNLLTGGLMLGFGSEGFTPGGLSWSTQWNGQAYDPAASPGEGFENNERLSYLETGVGANYRYQSDSSRTHANIGIGLFHFQAPETRFINLGNPRLPMRTALNAMVNLQVTNAFDVQLNGLGQFQGPFREYLFGALAKLHVNQQKGKRFRIDLGAAYRVGTDGFIIPKLAFKYNDLYLGLSYDINLGKFKESFSSRGGPEVHVRYIITKVKALNQKPCPVY